MAKKKTDKQLESLRDRRYNAPLTYAEAVVIKMLPAVGTRVGLKEIGLSVNNLKTQLKDEGATPGFLSGLIVSLKHRDLVRDVVLIPRNQGVGYQRTKRGEEFLREYEKNYNDQG